MPRTRGLPLNTASNRDQGRPAVLARRRTPVPTLHRSCAIPRSRRHVAIKFHIECECLAVEALGTPVRHLYLRFFCLAERSPSVEVSEQQTRLHSGPYWFMDAERGSGASIPLSCMSSPELESCRWSAPAKQELPRCDRPLRVWKGIPEEPRGLVRRCNVLPSPASFPNTSAARELSRA